MPNAKIGAPDQVDQHDRGKDGPQIEGRPALYFNHGDKLGVRLRGRPAGQLALSHLRRHLADDELFVGASGIEADDLPVGHKDHLVTRPAERPNPHLKRLATQMENGGGPSPIEMSPSPRAYM